MTSERSADWMFDQVRHAAGIHMSTFKTKPGAPPTVEEGDEEDGGGEAEGGSNWTPPPSFWAEMKKAGA